MTPVAGGPERLLEEQIRDDVSGIIAATGRMPELAYMVSPADAMEIGSRVIMRRVRLKAPSAIEVHTDGGWVDVIADENCPRGVACRSYRCSCGALFVDDSSQSGKCVVCTMRGVEDRAGRVAKSSTVPCDLCGKPTSRGLEEWAGRHAACSVPDRIAELRQQKELAQARRDQMQLHRVSYLSNGDARIECATNSAVLPGSEWIDAAKAMQHAVAIDHLTDEASAMLPVNPLDVKYDGVTLRVLLEIDEDRRRELPPEHGRSPLAQRLIARRITPAQRAAVSAHWSAELRAKVAASKERERNVVRIDLDDDAC